MNMTMTWRMAIALLAMEAWGSVVEAAELKLVSSLSLGTRAHHLVLSDDENTAYVATDLGLTIVDVSNRANPVKVGSVRAGTKALGIALKGTHVYLATSSPDLVVVDASTPSAPAVVASRSLPNYGRDVAVKGDVLYVGSWGGEVYVYDLKDNPADPQLHRVLGIPAWNAGNPQGYLDKLNAYITAGNAKVDGLSVVGDRLSIVEGNYGRLYYYGVGNGNGTALDPKFLGTHFASYALQVQNSPDNEFVYILGTFGNASNVFSVPTSILAPNIETRQPTCAVCGTFKIPATDYGGITVSANGKYVVYIAGKIGVVQVLDVSNPPAITDAGSYPIPGHRSKSFETMGVKTTLDNYIITAAGALGLQVFSFPHLAD